MYFKIILKSAKIHNNDNPPLINNLAVGNKKRLGKAIFS
jgi:hypothetical protein